jgi:hypothetical protein
VRKWKLNDHVNGAKMIYQTQLPVGCTSLINTSDCRKGKNLVEFSHIYFVLPIS